MLTQLVVWLNRLAGALAGVLLAPVAWAPGWLSVTAIAVVTGILMLLAFKYTSDQAEIHRTRNRIRSSLLALSLFKDDLRVGLRCQLELLQGALRLLTLSLVPMLIMLVPMCLLLGQLSLWYQARPLRVGEDAVVTVHLATHHADADVQLQETSGFEIAAGPVRVPQERMVCWNIVAKEAGRSDLPFAVGGQTFTKQLSVGNGYLPTSLKRPGWSWADALVYPQEEPLPADSPIASIEVDFPERSSWIAGSRSWLIYWFAMSMLSGLAARPLLDVKL